MTTGLRALAALATVEPLDYEVSVMTGQMLVVGYPAPSELFYRRSQDRIQYLAENSREVRRARRPEERQARLKEQLIGPTTRLETAQRADRTPATESEELTLVDLRIYPAVGAAGTRSGGLWLAAFRVPYAAVSGWWIVDGDEIPGSGGGGGTAGFGFAFDLS